MMASNCGMILDATSKAEVRGRRFTRHFIGLGAPSTLEHALVAAPEDGRPLRS